MENLKFLNCNGIEQQICELTVGLKQQVVRGNIKSPPTFEIRVISPSRTSTE